MMLLKILGKIIIEIVFVCKLIEYEAVIEFYLNMFGTEASTMTMHLGRLLLIRVQTSSDIIVVTLMPFYWMMEKYKKSIRSLLFALSGIYTLIVFSSVCCSVILLEENPEEGKMHRGDSCACFVGIMVEACDTNDRIPVLFFICCGIR